MYDVPMHLPRAILIFLAASLLTAVAQSADDADSVLSRARERLLGDLERLPRYTCVQTITRRYYRPQMEGASCKKLMDAYATGKSHAKPRGWDRLRLEVAIVDRENVFSWVGAPRFESGTLERLAGGGPLSSGDFGPFLHSIFSKASIVFQSEERTGNRRLLSYSFDLPLERSGYRVRANDGWILTAYSGTFVLDPEDADIVSLAVRTAELPASTSSCQAISEVDYGRTPIHDRMVLIPRRTRLVVIDRQGGETESQTSYSTCREYASKTRMLFDGAPQSSAAPSQAPPTDSATPPFPAELHFRARIISSLDSDRSAAGDPLDVVLLTSIRDKHKVLIAPAGALLHARIVDFEQHSGAPDFFQVSIQFESIELNGKTVPLRATADPMATVGISVFKTPVSTVSHAAEDFSIFLFQKASLHLKKLDWGWTTLGSAADTK